MSNKKDVLKPALSSNRTKIGTSTSKASSSRDKSTDRNRIKKEETQVNKISSKSLLSNGKIKPALNPNTKTQLKPRKTATTVKETGTIKAKNSVTTPTSTRVTRTQYFPSKNLYSQALKSGDVSLREDSTRASNIKKKSSTSVVNSSPVIKKKPSSKISKDDSPVTGRRALPKKTKSKDVEKNEISSEASSLSDRPRTATLRKGSIVNNNIVGPDAPKLPKTNILKQKLDSSKTTESSLKQQPEETYDYEDDFDSYESDFEACTSSSSTSGSTINMDLPELSSDSSSSSKNDQSSDISIKQPPTNKRANSAGTDDERKLDSGNFDLTELKHKHLLDNIKESIEKENNDLINKTQEQNKSSFASLSDEGFEDGKSLQLINFVGAQKKYQHRKSIEKRKKRSEEIMSMIRLDSVSYTLYESSPVPYDIFIKKYGANNTVQTSVQTGDDDVCEETQTEIPNCHNKWTQFPVVFNKINLSDPNYWTNYKCDYLGVGCDDDNHKINATGKLENLNENYLEKFILSAGRLVLKVLNESKSDFKMEKLNSVEAGHPFSKGFLTFNTDFEFFRNSSVVSVSICAQNPDVILTIHTSNWDSEKNSSMKSVVCIWNICNLLEPQFWLACYGELSCSCFGIQADVVFGGLKDGSIVIWDTTESNTIHNNLQNFVDYNILFRSETFRTEINSGHNTKVVAIQQLCCANDNMNSATNEICSLEEIGDIIIWSVVTKNYNNKETVLENQGLAHWGATMIMKTALISLRELYPNLIQLQCTDLIINTVDSKYMFVSTNYGHILQCSVNTSKSNLKQFIPETNSSSSVNCLDICPFSPLYFASGNNDGNVNLYSRLKETPILILNNEKGDETSYTEMVQWSRNRPFIIYTKDQNNTIHIWDLKKSEISPIRSIPFKENITSIKLSPKYENKKSVMVIATGEGTIELHLFNEEHTWESETDHEKSVSEFLDYFNSL